MNKHIVKIEKSVFVGLGILGVATLSNPQIFASEPNPQIVVDEHELKGLLDLGIFAKSIPTIQKKSPFYIEKEAESTWIARCYVDGINTNQATQECILHKETGTKLWDIFCDKSKYIAKNSDVGSTIEGVQKIVEKKYSKRTPGDSEKKESE